MKKKNQKYKVHTVPVSFQRLLISPIVLSFRNEALQTHHFPQKLTSLNQVINKFYCGLCESY